MKQEYYEECLIKMTEDKKYKRNDLVKFYAYMIFEREVFKRKVRIEEVNDKIISRWSLSSLEYILNKAWAMYYEMRKT